jgi:hypothetical protein
MAADGHGNDADRHTYPAPPPQLVISEGGPPVRNPPPGWPKDTPPDE